MLLLGAIAGAVLSKPGERVKGAVLGAVVGAGVGLAYSAVITGETGKSPEERTAALLDSLDAHRGT